MPNHCEVLITRGKNKGRICREVNRVCRHCNLICGCGEIFAYKHTLSNHKLKCPFAQDESATTDGIVNHWIDRQTRRPIPASYYPLDGESSGCSLESNQVPQLKIRLNPKEEATEFRKRLETLEERNRKLEERLAQAENRSTNINNFVIIGQDFFAELTDIVGTRVGAAQFLSDTLNGGNAIGVVKKLYLEGRDPMQYPIACRDSNHFRYLGADSRIIDDRGGEAIGNIVTDRVQKAVLLAINEMIAAGIDDEEVDTDTLDRINASHRYLEDIDKNELVSQLAAITHNNNHPFFNDQSIEG
jgi:hypothetical protein